MTNIDEIREAEKREAEIRADFAAALEAAECGEQVAAEVGWGFWPEDILSLLKLHRDGRLREKIEAMLTDSNFHTDCRMLAEGQYDALEARLNREIGQPQPGDASALLPLW